jgi:hypothetical protein
MIYLIYCKNFCKCHIVPSHSTTIKKINKTHPRRKQNLIVKKQTTNLKSEPKILTDVSPKIHRWEMNLKKEMI